MTKLLSQHFRCTALRIWYLWLYSYTAIGSLIAWPKLSCVYCTGKASGWFFRHEMSDLFSAALCPDPDEIDHGSVTFTGDSVSDTANYTLRFRLHVDWRCSPNMHTNGSKFSSIFTSTTRVQA